MNNKKKPFYPDYLFEILFATIITLEIVLIISLLFPPPLGRQIDFNAMYRPVPEWYFFWIFELIKYFPGKTTFIGAMGIPFAVFFIILLTPFLDRTPETSLKKRPKTVVVTVSLTVLITVMTIMSYV
jgi:quinol-cytochrome oxidoreductase complex cytochrome b subunit